MCPVGDRIYLDEATPEQLRAELARREASAPRRPVCGAEGCVLPPAHIGPHSASLVNLCGPGVACHGTCVRHESCMYGRISLWPADQPGWQHALIAAGLVRGEWVWHSGGEVVIGRDALGEWFQAADPPAPYPTEEAAARAWLAAREVPRG